MKAPGHADQRALNLSMDLVRRFRGEDTSSAMTRSTFNHDNGASTSRPIASTTREHR
jgi:hypothetical protein